jgi:hypothetical protein
VPRELVLPPPAILTGVDPSPAGERIRPPPRSSAPGILGANPGGAAGSRWA